MSDASNAGLEGRQPACAFRWNSIDVYTGQNNTKREKKAQMVNLNGGGQNIVMGWRPENLGSDQSVTTERRRQKRGG